MEIKNVEIFEGKISIDKLVETKKILDDYVKILESVFDFYPQITPNKDEIILLHEI